MLINKSYTTANKYIKNHIDNFHSENRKFENVNLTKIGGSHNKTDIIFVISKSKYIR